MEEKTIHLDFTEQEIGVIWQTLMSGSVQGQNAIHVVTATQKIQIAINAANKPREPEAVEEEKPKENAA